MSKPKVKQPRESFTRITDGTRRLSKKEREFMSKQLPLPHAPKALRRVD